MTIKPGEVYLSSTHLEADEECDVRLSYFLVYRVENGFVHYGIVNKLTREWEVINNHQFEYSMFTQHVELVTDPQTIAFVKMMLL